MTAASTPTVPPFDLCGDLPSGTVVLEASAGTGKTFTVASLAARYVAEGYAQLSELMIVSFSRAATQELRDRVRHRLLEIHDWLGDPAAARDQVEDTLAGRLAIGSDAEVGKRRERLRHALADFDAATIATYHGFCQQMLAGLGVAGDLEPASTFVESIKDLVTEVAEDLYLRKFANSTDDPPFDVGTARAIAREAVGDAQARLVPGDGEAPAGSPAAMRQRFASAVRREVAARKRRLRLLDYDDLLTRLRDALADPVTGPAAIELIRSRYRVVMVDEFQDTDPVQWEILRRTFDGLVTLVLIGDPKQAIYAFRGADLTTYLQAAAGNERRTLGRNWRTDEQLIEALDQLFRGAALGDEEVVVRPVVAEYVEPRLTDGGAPLQLRVLTQQLTGGGTNGASVPGVRPIVATDLANHLVALLSGPARLTLDDSPVEVRPSDIAVLVRSHAQADLVHSALRAANIPAVLTGIRSVFRSTTAREWLTLLRAVEQPHRHGLARAAALTCFIGWPAERLASDPDALDALATDLRDWRTLLIERGVAAMLEVVVSSQHVYERLLATTSGERTLTDLRHVGEALHAAALDAQLGPSALVEWLNRRIVEAGEESDDERSWRLDSDAGAVQVATVHTSKGLEWPIVYVPFGWDRYVDFTPKFPRLHDASGQRVLEVGGKTSPTYAANKIAYLDEDFGEDLRLLYVAMTRAQCQTITWWARTTTTKSSPLHRLVFGPNTPGSVPPSSVKLPTDVELRLRMSELTSAAGGALSVVEIHPPSVSVWSGAPARDQQLSVEPWNRSVDTAWRRTSYSRLTADAHAAAYNGTASGSDGDAIGPVGSEPERDERHDEPDVGAALDSDAAPPADLVALPSPMSELPAGTAFGLLVHEVLEHVDTADGALSTDALAVELNERCLAAAAWRHGATPDPGPLADALLPVMLTPLGEAAGDARLATIPSGDRLAELDFELPLAGGDVCGPTAATVAGLSELMRTHLSADDPLAAYPDHLDPTGIGWQRLSGYLAGSIDGVLRLPADDGEQPRFSVVDYKTNWLGGLGPDGPEPLTSLHYRPAAMSAAMIHADYPLQALLYSVALHRYLRWRLPSYEPARHLGPVLYLFVRGMCGEATPVIDGMVCGVFTWQLPTALVEKASQLLAGSS